MSTRTPAPASGTRAALVAKFGEMTPDMERAFANYTSALSDAQGAGVGPAMVNHYLNLETESSDCRSLFTWMAVTWSGVDANELVC